jgi:hypothetical protein
MKTKNVNLFTALLLTGLILISTRVSGQKIEIAPFVGYETGASISTSIGHLHIGDGMDFGGSLNVGMGGGRWVELSYSHMASYLDLESGLNTERLCDLNVDYYSIGVLQEIKPDAKATPYGLFTLGWVNYRPQEKYDNENKMHVSPSFNAFVLCRYLLHHRYRWWRLRSIRWYLWCAG